VSIARFFSSGTEEGDCGKDKRLRVRVGSEGGLDGASSRSTGSWDSTTYSEVEWGLERKPRETVGGEEDNLKRAHSVSGVGRNQGLKNPSLKCRGPETAIYGSQKVFVGRRNSETLKANRLGK